VALALKLGTAMDVLMKGAAMAFAESTSARGIGFAARRMTVAAWCVTLATAFAIASVGCVVTALWVFVLPEVGPVGAPLIAAAALFLVCLPLLLIAQSVLRRPRQTLPARALPDAAIPALLIAEASRLLEENKGAALLAALLAGATAGNPNRK
jgi:hypothetical protein